MKSKKIKVKLFNGERFYCAIDLADAIVPPEATRNKTSAGMHPSIWYWIKRNIPSDRQAVDTYLDGDTRYIWIGESHVDPFMEYVWIRARRMMPQLVAVLPGQTKRLQPVETRGRTRYTLALERRIVTMRKLGAGYDDITKELRIGAKTVARALRKNGMLGMRV